MNPARACAALLGHKIRNVRTRLRRQPVDRQTRPAENAPKGQERGEYARPRARRRTFRAWNWTADVGGDSSCLNELRLPDIKLMWAKLAALPNTLA